MKRLFLLLILNIILIFSVSAQTEKLANTDIVEMSKVGLSADVILKKIEKSTGNFDISSNALIELKKSGVADEIISAMIEKAATSESYSPASNAKTFSENAPANEDFPTGRINQTPKEILRSARTIAFEKSSIQPSRQALEKELLKRADFKKLNLTIERYKDNADLFVEIGFVSMSWITHRYVYRIYDRRSGAVLAAGETTSWGSLAENLARHIAKSLKAIAESN